MAAVPASGTRSAGHVALIGGRGESVGWSARGDGRAGSPGRDGAQRAEHEVAAQAHSAWPCVLGRRADYSVQPGRGAWGGRRPELGRAQEYIPQGLVVNKLPTTFFLP